MSQPKRDSQAGTSRSLAASSHVATPVYATPSSRPPDGTPDAAFEGESSLMAHSRFANDFAEKTLHGSASGKPKAAVEETLAALKQLTSSLRPTQTEHDTWFDHAIPTVTAINKPELPPFAAVAALLKAERGIEHRATFSDVPANLRFREPASKPPECMDQYHNISRFPYATLYGCLLL